MPPLARTGVPVSVSLHVVAEGKGTPSGTLSVEGGDGEPCSLPAPGGTCMLEFAEAGERTIKAAYNGDSNFEATGENDVQVEVVGLEEDPS